eukprot:364809-Chlamydomonas_euryale.AAC.6
MAEAATKLGWDPGAVNARAACQGLDIPTEAGWGFAALLRGRSEFMGAVWWRVGSFRYSLVAGRD